MIRLYQLIPAAIISLITTPSLSQDWIEYIHRTDQFSIMFPDIPEVQETTRLSAHNVPFPARVYSNEDSFGSYSITVVDYTDAERRHQERPDQTDASSGRLFWVMDVRASVAYTAQSFRSRGGEVTYDGWTDNDKIEGHQLQITNPDQSRSFVAIFLHASRLYILEGTVPQGHPPPGLFQQSLRILNAEGRRIRYTLDPDGQRVNVNYRDLSFGREDELVTARQVIVE